MTESDWTKFYYASPEPSRLPAEVRRTTALPQLASPGPQLVFATFLGRVMASQPERVAGWIEELRDLTGAGRTTLEIAARFSRTPAGLAWLQRIGSPALRGEPPDLFALPVDDGTMLDMLWSHYFATGEARAVRRIVTAFEKLGSSGAAAAYATSGQTEADRKRANEDAVYSAASWSLTSMMTEHAPLLTIAEDLVAAPALSPNERVSVAMCLERAAPSRWRVVIDPVSKSATIQRLAR